MRASVFLIAGLFFAVAPDAVAADLPHRLVERNPDGWVSYQVPLVDGVGVPCCFTWRKGAATSTGCDFDEREWGFGSDSKHPASSDERLAVYAHVHDGAIDKVRAVAASCPVRADDLVRIDGVTTAESIAWLRDVASAGDRRGDGDETLAALAYHGDPAATTALVDLAGAGHPDKVREPAIFWLGQARGADGAARIATIAKDDKDPEIRKHAVFSLSQSEVPEAYPRIVTIARDDASPDVRAHALFCLSQTDDARAAGDIEAAIRADASDDVREQGVFALSQLDDGVGDRALIALVRGNHPRDVKQKALFWLGQSGSTEAIAFLDEVLAGP